ncbi:MAG: cell surface protein SprA, partial [Sphingobacteriales bacterium]
WYTIEPTLIDPGSGIPDYVKTDPNQHYIRLITQQEVFKQKGGNTFNNALPTFDIAYYPRERGPYNFSTNNIDADGRFTNPAQNWGGIMRSIENSDFEQSNVEFIEFWVMDPFINRDPNTKGGSLYINLGNVSEDVLKDGRKFFENGIPYPKDISQLDSSIWGYAPKFQQQITRAFLTDAAARKVQDVGYDGLDNTEEQAQFSNYLARLTASVNPAVAQKAAADPSSDDFRFFRDADYEQRGARILERYKDFNNPHGNSPIADATANVSSAGTNIPEAEDINRDNTLNETEEYYQYRVDFTPNMQVGTNYIINKQLTAVKLPNNVDENETWYQFKVPIREFSNRVGNIADFRSIRFIRMYLNGFEDSVVMRFARLELGRNNWRRYLFSLQSPGENIPEDDLQTVDFAVTSVSLEENGDRTPIPYVTPPGVQRQLSQVGNGQTIQQNEQALALQVCGLKDGDSRAVFKEVSVDMRQFTGLRMFIHAESQAEKTPIKNGDIRATIRIGSDFTNNYYEYQIPLQISAPTSTSAEEIWPTANNINLILDDLVNAKTERNAKNVASFVPYFTTDSKGNTIVVVGNPNIGDAKTMLLGITNPKKTNSTPDDDGMAKCAEVWFNEMRMIGMNEKPGYAAAGKVTVQLADLASVNLSGSMHTEGYGNIDQKLNQRFRDNFYQYAASTNVNVGKLMPKTWGVQLPIFVGYSENVSNPQYDPYDLDVKYKDKIADAATPAEKKEVREKAQDFTSITSVNASNVRVLGNPEKQKESVMPWSVKNFDLSYAYNKQFKRNPLVEKDEIENQKLGLGYTYAIKSKPVEPFKRAIRSKSKWLSLVKDFNFNPLPANFAFRTDLNRTVNETQVRNITDDPFEIPSTFFKNFTWQRLYTMRWELTKSLSFDYTATNNSRIDEPYGRIDTKAKQDSLWDKISRFGRNTFYSQAFNASYTLPLQKLPITDWTSLRLSYGANYTWTAASQLARSLGNTIGNTNTKQVNAELNFTQLYNKNRWLRAVNQPARPQTKQPNKPGGMLNPQKPGSPNANTELPAGNENKNVKDLRSNRNTDKKSDAATPSKNDTAAKKDIASSTAGLTDQQLDSLHTLQKQQAAAKKKADKAKRKKDRKAARAKKRATTPAVTPVERFGGKLLTMVKRSTLSYTENSGTVLPGFMDSTRFMGINNYSGAPGFDFVYGYQPDRAWLETQAAQGRLSNDTLFNAQFQQQYSQNINATATIEPFQDFRIDLTLTKSFSKNHNELFKDTSVSRSGLFTHNNPYETGSFNVTYIGFKTLFGSASKGAATYDKFIGYRTTVSDRLSRNNPYSNSVPDPNDPDYKKGYSRYSQDVLVPAFVAAYTGKDVNSVGLVEYDNTSIRSNPFKNYKPMPNWRVSYNGLAKLPMFKPYFNNIVVTHTYTGTLSMNSFVSSLFYMDIFDLGFPSFLDSNSGNFVPFYQVPNVTFSEQLNPLFGVDMALKNNLTARFDLRKTRTASLSMVDYQVSETKSTEYVFGMGYRIRGLVLPVTVFGVRKLDNDLNVKVDIGLRDDKTSNNYLAQNIEVVTRGQKVITISPSVDYIISDKLTLRFFYDRRQSIPYT